MHYWKISFALQHVYNWSLGINQIYKNFWDIRIGANKFKPSPTGGNLRFYDRFAIVIGTLLHKNIKINYIFFFWPRATSSLVCPAVPPTVQLTVYSLCALRISLCCYSLSISTPPFRSRNSSPSGWLGIEVNVCGRGFNCSVHTYVLLHELRELSLSLLVFKATVFYLSLTRPHPPSP